MKKSYNFWLEAWYGKAKWIYFLLPLSWVFRVISAIRKYVLINYLQKTVTAPVIIVGNISIGGTGKTPLIIALVKYLQRQGYKPGVVSRGYGGIAPEYPYLLNQSTRVEQSGDEPLLIFRSSECAVCVAPDRIAAANKLIEQGCNIILSDDGLQHYRLGRALEIVVIDGRRLFGNEQCLPAGPLRESTNRLKTVDMIVVNNPPAKKNVLEYPFYPMKIQPFAWRAIQAEQIIPLHIKHFNQPLHAVAGIGNPQRFYQTLSELSLDFVPHAFTDHHKFESTDFLFSGNDDVVMTEKDAIKCQEFAQPQWFSLLVNAQLPDSFWQAFDKKIISLKVNKR